MVQHVSVLPGPRARCAQRNCCTLGGRQLASAVLAYGFAPSPLECEGNEGGTRFGLRAYCNRNLGALLLYLDSCVRYIGKRPRESAEQGPHTQHHRLQAFIPRDLSRGGAASTSQRADSNAAPAPSQASVLLNFRALRGCILKVFDLRCSRLPLTNPRLNLPLSSLPSPFRPNSGHDDSDRAGWPLRRRRHEHHGG